MIRIVTALVLLASTALPANAAIRTHGTLQSCMVTIGNFCPIESIGISLLGTGAIALVLFILGLAWRAMTGTGRQRSGNYGGPLMERTPRHFDPMRFAGVNNLMAIGDYDAAATAIAPFLEVNDPDATPYADQIRARLQEWHKRAEMAMDLMKAGEDGAAFRYVKKLAEEGDNLSMFNLGVLLIKGTGTPAAPVEGMKWISLAARRGEPNAAELMQRDAGTTIQGREMEVEGFVSGWKPT